MAAARGDTEAIMAFVRSVKQFVSTEHREWIALREHDRKPEDVIGPALDPVRIAVPGGKEETAGESGERPHAATMLARNSSSHAATLRFIRKESLLGALRIRLCAMCLSVTKLAGA